MSNLKEQLERARAYDDGEEIIAGQLEGEAFAEGYNLGRQHEHAKDQRLNELVDAVVVAAESYDQNGGKEPWREVQETIAALKSHVAGEGK